jgi:hypothetical protein
MKREVSVCKVVTEYNSFVRKLCLPLLALSLVLVACGKKDEGEAPKANTPAGGPPVTFNAEPGAQPKEEFNPMKAKEQIGKTLDQAMKDVKPVPPGKDQWTKGPTKAEALAVATEKSLRALRGVSAEATIKGELPSGKGISIGKAQIQTPNRFYVEFVNVKPQKEPYWEKQVLVANGSEYAVNALSSSGWSKAKPVAALSNEGNTDVNAWATEFPRVIFSALQGGKPLSNLVAKAQAQGLDVLTEGRTLTAQGRQIKQHRLFITRKKADVAKKGKLEYEVIIDDLRRMPVTIRSSMEPVGQKPVNIMWSIRWNFGIAQKFDPKNFTIPKPGSSSRTAKL